MAPSRSTRFTAAGSGSAAPAQLITAALPANTSTSSRGSAARSAMTGVAPRPATASNRRRLRAPARTVYPRRASNRTTSRPVRPVDPSTVMITASGSGRRLTGRGRRHLVLVLREVAGHPLPGRELHQRRLLGLAHLLGLPAPGVEPAGGRRVDRARDIALQPDALPLGAPVRVRDRHRGQQRDR